MDFAAERASSHREPIDLVRDPRREPPGDKLAPKAVVGRVSLYLRQLETFQRQGITTISSSQLGAALAINNAQVRKDLAFFGQFGYPGDRLPDRGADRRLAAHPGDRPRLAAGAGRAGQPRPRLAQVPRVPEPRLPHRRALRQRPRRRSARPTTA